MRSHQGTIGLFALAAVWLLTWPGHAATSRPEAEPWAAMEEILAAEMALLNPVGERSARQDEPDSGCQFIATDLPQQNFAGQNRYRGNMFRIERDVELTEFQFELVLPATTGLYFSVHEKDSDVAGTTYSPVYIGEPVNSLPVLGPQGTPVKAFYSSGPVHLPGQPNEGILLSRGKDYALGVAWAGQTVTAFNTSAIQYPQNFPAGAEDEERDGQVRGGLLWTSFPAGTLPLPDDEDTTFPTQSNLLAFAMQLCLTPRPGACCDSTLLSCLDGVFEVACTADGSFFHGERSRCADVLCSFGACCTACGACLPDYALPACPAAGGIQHWPGLACPADATVLCPPVTGACCIGSGPARQCEELCEQECSDAGGFYHGDGTTCDTDLCRGACCVRGGCVDLTPNECTVFSGDYKGDGTACDRLFEGDECGGACCRGFTTLDQCVIVPSRDDCTTQFPQMAYLGDGAVCRSCGQLTDYGSCCLADGTCVNTTADFCQDAELFPWVLGEVNTPKCSESGIDCVTSADCKTCSVNTDDGCTINADCPKVCLGNPTQTCATSTDCGVGGSCVSQVCELLQTCRSSTLCEDVEPCGLGACCFPDGSCEVLTQTGCTGLGGVGWTAGGSCAPNTCVGTTGACCLCTGTCVSRNVSQCEAVRGLYQGDGILCADVTCTAFGACCRGDGLCTEQIDATTCTTVFEGAYGGNCTLCEDVIEGCDQRGQCCSPQGNCTFVPLNLCGDPGTGWAFDPAGNCDAAVPCVSGACCMPADETCERLTKLACGLRGGLYAGDLTSCLTDCQIGACLRSDTVCEDTVEFDCTAQGGEFREDLRCEAVGACCLSDNVGFCLRRTVDECADVPNGLYQGDGTVCEGDACSLGACCTGQATCTPNRFASQCAEGEFHVNLSCAANPCPGACCLGGGACVRSRVDDCAALGGEFTSGGICTSIICGGACCRADGTCSFTADWECTAPGAQFTAGQTCANVTCAPRGACCKAGSCTSYQTEAACTAGGGVYQGDDSACVGGRCDLGGCCHLDGTCVGNVVASQCTAPDDVFGEAGCGTFPCPVRGACCEASGACTIKTSSGCTSGGGTFTAPGVACDDTVCDVGACCLVEDPACAALPAAVCAADGGVFEGDGEVCAGACSESGLACDTDADCRKCRLAAEISCTMDADCPKFCINQVGQPACNSVNDCLVPPCEGACPVQTCDSPRCARGACCTPDGGCLDNVIPSQCAGAADDFRPGLMCADLQQICQPKRACCINGTCTLTTQTACIEDGGTFAPNVTACAADSCQSGACCRPDGSCVTRTRQLCENGSGVFQGVATVCAADGLCHACCPGDGTCTDTISPNCVGTYIGDAACIDEPCPGACCEPDGTCTQTTADECAILEGRFTPNTACDVSCRGFGACCHEGRCTIEFFDDCAAASGVYQDDGTACGDVNCTLGACVAADGSCADLTVASECDGFTESFHPGDTCGVIPGACCLGQACESLTEQGCLSRGGTFNGVSIECTANFCVPGACCHVDGTCDDVTGIDCDGANDLFFGNSLCAETECPPRGACCIDEACSVRSEQVCTEQGGSWQGAGVECTMNVCVIGACCHIDGTCDDVIGVECSGEGDDFIGTSVCGDVTCPRKGACCDGGECTIEHEADCAGLGGTYQGDGVPCDPDPCAAAANVVRWTSVAMHGATIGEVGLLISQDGSYVEPRSTGMRKIIVTYDGPVTAAGSTAGVVAACAAAGVPVDVSGNVVSTAQGAPEEVIITFAPQLPGSGLAPGTHTPTRYLVELTGVGGAAADTSREFSVVLGDAFIVPTTGLSDARVTAADNGVVRSLAAAGTDPINPGIVQHVRADIFTDGRINAADNGLVRSLAAEGLNGQGLTVPCP